MFLPDSVFDGYRVGAKNGDLLNVVVNNSGASADYTAGFYRYDICFIQEAA